VQEEEASEDEPPRSTQRPRQTQQDDSEEDEDDDENDDDESRDNIMEIGEEEDSQEQLVKKLVRYALACEYQRMPIRRAGISEKGIFRPAFALLT
jgi:hypothetical protein